MRGVKYCFFSYSCFSTKIYLFLAFQDTKRVAYLFFGRFSRPETSQKIPGYLRPTLNTLYQVTPTLVGNSRVTVGPALQFLWVTGTKASRNHEGNVETSTPQVIERIIRTQSSSAAIVCVLHQTRRRTYSARNLYTSKDHEGMTQSALRIFNLLEKKYLLKC